MKKFRKLFAILMTLGLLAEGSPASTLAEPLPPEELPAEVTEPKEETVTPNEDAGQTADENQSDQPQIETGTSFEDIKPEDPAVLNKEEGPGEPAAENAGNKTADENNESADAASGNTEETPEEPELTLLAGTEEPGESDPVDGYSITLTGGANAEVSGEVNQTGVTGEMKTVTYTAKTDYIFPETSDYYATTSGVTVERTSETVVTVSGTPEADVDITVPDAEESSLELTNLALKLGAEDAAEDEEVMEPVTYLDWDGTKLVPATCENYKVVTDSTTNWNDGWYVVKGNVTMNGPVTVTGNAHLILYNGASLNVKASEKSQNAIGVNNNCYLTIYAQSNDQDMGSLTADGLTEGIMGIAYTGLLNDASLTINGGNITALGSTSGIAFLKPTIINSGNVIAIGKNQAIFGRVQNSIPGTGWDDIDGTGSGVTINPNIMKPEAQYYKRLQFLSKPIPVSEITLNPSETQTLTVDGDPVKFTATIKPDAATNKTVKWNVNNGNVKLYSDEPCTREIGENTPIDKPVYAKGISEGSATITVTSIENDSISASCEVTVKSVPVSGITLSPSETQTVEAGNYVAFTATIEPDGATDKTVKWSVNNSNVKLYSDEACTQEIGKDATNALTVYAKGESAGKATITVTSNADKTKTETCDVIVTGLVKYKDWDNGSLQDKTCEKYQVVTEDTKEWKEGWYVVTENVTIPSQVNVTGDVHLILCEGATLTVSAGNSVSAVNINANSNLTVYAQSEESGTLIAEGAHGIYADGYSDGTKTSNLTIDCGTVIAKGNADNVAYGIFAKGLKDQITINSGNVTAEGNVHGIYAYGTNSIVTINNATVTATGKELNGITALNDVIINGGTVTAKGTEEGIAVSKSITISESSTVTASGERQAIKGTVKNSAAGTGWINAKGTQGQTDIAAKPEGQELTYEKVSFPTASKYYVYKGNNTTWQKGSSNKLTIEFKCEGDDTQTFTNWEKYVQIDGTVIAESSYTAEQGSLVVNLQPAYLNTLSAGKHTMYVSFVDGAAEAVFNVEAEEDSKKSDSTPAQKEDNVVTCQMAGYPANYAWNESAKACPPGYLDDNGVFHSTAVIRRAGIPNTYDVGVAKYLWAFIASALAAFICSVVLVRDDHD